MRQDLENLREGAAEGIFKYFTFRAIAFCLSLDDDFPKIRHPMVDKFEEATRDS